MAAAPFLWKTKLMSLVRRRTGFDDFQIASQRGRNRTGERVWQQMSVRGQEEVTCEELRSPDAERHARVTGKPAATLTSS